MSTRHVHRALPAFLLLTSVAFTACLGPTSPTEADIEEDLRAQSASVAGTWKGFSHQPVDELPLLQFSLTQAGTSVSGSGVMHEKGRPDTLAITVAGSYAAPRASLTISGMRFEGRTVTGVLRATNSVGIMTDTLVLTGTDYERKLLVFISRQ
ncbi:MAG: hypothetical protein V4813_15315 [Gemmatimonadota bacterium]